MISKLDISTDVNAKLQAETQINAASSSTINIVANLEDSADFNGELDIGDVAIDGNVEIGLTTSNQTYTGAYEVTSFLPDDLTTTSVVLHTSNKVMARNVTIYSLPVSEEYNSQGGVTMTIGG